MLLFFCKSRHDETLLCQFTSPKQFRQASLVSNEGLRGNFPPPTQFTFRWFFFFFPFFLSMTSPPFQGLSFTSSGGHIEQQIEYSLNKLKTGSKKYWLKCSFQLWLGDLPLEQQVVNPWHYCIFPLSCWNWNLQTEPYTRTHTLTWQNYNWSRASFLCCMLFSFPPFLIIFFSFGHNHWGHDYCAALLYDYIGDLWSIVWHYVSAQLYAVYKMGHNQSFVWILNNNGPPLLSAETKHWLLIWN